jgi:hypothetical protein
MNMPYLNDDEINDLVSRAVSKAIGNRKEGAVAENAAAEGSSRTYHYCREPRRELVQADSAQDILRVLEAHVSLQAGELIEILSATDGGTALT